MVGVRVYRTTVKPLIAGPQGMMQYDAIATAGSKAEAATVAGVSPGAMEWCRDSGGGVVTALRGADLLGSTGELFLTGATRGDQHLVHRRDGEGWSVVGRMAYGDMYRNPRLEPYEGEVAGCR